MRTEKRRLDKYKEKVSGDINKIRTEYYGKEQKEQFKISTAEAVKIEEMIKTSVGGKVPTNMLIYYIVFGKELYKILKKYQGETMKKEIELLQRKWQGRGLDINYLNQIKLTFNASLLPPPQPQAGWGLIRWGTDPWG